MLVCERLCNTEKKQDIKRSHILSLDLEISLGPGKEVYARRSAREKMPHWISAKPRDGGLDCPTSIATSQPILRIPRRHTITQVRHITGCRKVLSPRLQGRLCAYGRITSQRHNPAALTHLRFITICTDFTTYLNSFKMGKWSELDSVRTPPSVSLRQ
jgi:hypothetical protein